MNIFKCSIAISKPKDYGLSLNLMDGNDMRFGFFKYFLLAIILIVGGGFGWLAIMDLPVQQQEIIVNVPVNGAQ